MKLLLSHTALACLGMLLLTGCGGKDQGQKQSPPPLVGVITVQPQSAPLTKDLVGRLSAFRSADVRARVPGVLLTRTYEEGSDVKKGQVLFKIDPAPLKAMLDSSQAALAQAQATYTNNKIAAKRAHELAPKGYVSKSDLDTADANERTAAAAVKQARASVESARINLGYASVVAPIDGRAGQQQVTEGALVGNGAATLLTTVDQIDPVYVNFSISVGELNQMRSAQETGNVTLARPDTAKVLVTLPDGSKYAHPGTLDFSAASVNPATGSVSLRAKVPNPQHFLLPGMFVSVKADLGEQHHVFRIPQQAVQRDTAGAYVLVIKDGKAERKGIDTESLVGSDWIVDKGLDAGDQVVVSGIQKARDGQPARSEPWRPDQATSAATSGQASSTPSASRESKTKDQPRAGNQ